MPCKRLTPHLRDWLCQVVDEAVAKKADLIVSYHPTPFRKFNKVVRENPVGRVVLKVKACTKEYGWIGQLIVLHLFCCVSPGCLTWHRHLLTPHSS